MIILFFTGKHFKDGKGYLRELNDGTFEIDMYDSNKAQCPDIIIHGLSEMNGTNGNDLMIWLVTHLHI